MKISRIAFEYSFSKNSNMKIPGFLDSDMWQEYYQIDYSRQFQDLIAIEIDIGVDNIIFS